MGTLQIETFLAMCIITLKILNHEYLRSLDMKYFLYHESYNTKIEGLSMSYECTCIKNLFDVHVQTKVHLSWTAPLYSNSGLHIKIHICLGLTHQKSNFLLFFPDPDAFWLCLRPLCITSNCKSMTIFLDQVTELVLSINNKVWKFKIWLNCKLNKDSLHPSGV